MIVDRAAASVHHSTFQFIGQCLRPGDLLVANDTRVESARLHARRSTGGRVELLLLSFEDHGPARAMLKSSKTVAVGEILELDEGIRARVVAPVRKGRTELLFEGRTPAQVMQTVGAVPLPPYIQRGQGPTDVDSDRYQTVYARTGGSVAAPTAGLHFTPDLIAQLESAGVGFATLTLDVGPGTFQPVRGELDEHRMEAERCSVDAGLVERCDGVREQGGRVVAVGTTSVRALETAGRGAEGLSPYDGATDLFIKPGHEFRAIDALITNFHLPSSTLLSLVMAFAGEDLTRAAYTEAVESCYRFYSYGDAMLVV